jgi:hypothetical protein
MYVFAAHAWYALHASVFVDRAVPGQLLAHDGCMGSKDKLRTHQLHALSQCRTSALKVGFVHRSCETGSAAIGMCEQSIASLS